MRQNSQMRLTIIAADFDINKSRVSDCFSGSPQIEVSCENQVVPQSLDTYPSEFLNWILEIKPQQLWQLTEWALLTYGGKKVLDGFAAEAGKDIYIGGKHLIQKTGSSFYHGFKKIASLMRESNTDYLYKRRIRLGRLQLKLGDISSILHLSSHGTTQDGLVNYEVKISFDVLSYEEHELITHHPDMLNCPLPDENELTGTFDDLATFVLPLLGCMSRKSGTVDLSFRRFSNKRWAVSSSEWKSREFDLFLNIDLTNKHFTFTEKHKHRFGFPDFPEVPLFLEEVSTPERHDFLILPSMHQLLACLDSLGFQEKERERRPDLEELSRMIFHESAKTSESDSLMERSRKRKKD